jgi:phage shock protein A
MGVLKRLTTLIKSNLNDAVDSMQDPAKEFDQMVRDMEDAGRKARQEVATCLAEEKRLGKRLESLNGEIEDWERKAMQAVRAGDDALAKEALRVKSEKEAEKQESEKHLAEQKVQVDQLSAGLKALESRLKDVKLRQGTLRERARSAKGQGTVSTKTSAFEDFDRMAGRIDAMEASAGLDDELAGRTPESREAERKLEKMSDDQGLDDALAALKKKLGE